MKKKKHLKIVCEVHVQLSDFDLHSKTVIISMDVLCSTPFGLITYLNPPKLNF
jgi:hypothetical protein